MILAPWWHTALLVALIVTVALTGLLLARSTTATPARIVPPSGWGRVVSLYLPFVLVNAGLVFYVSRVGQPASALRRLLGELPHRARPLARDVALALLAAAIIEAGEAIARGHGGAGAAVLSNRVPVSALERAAWVAFAVTAAFCEEVIYRGYLQTQLGAFSGHAFLGVVLQALLFGLAHADQGLATGARFAVYAAGLGALAHARRGLFPGILCHGAVDLLSGLLPR